jgi:flagellar motor switch protein FliM
VSDILSEAEVSSLLHSLNPEEGEKAAEEGNPPAPTRVGSGGTHEIAAARRLRTGSNYEPYDFRRPDKFSKDQLRTLQMVHETFARLAGSGLSAYLRTPVNIDLISLEQVPYEEYLRSINQSVFAIHSVQPLTGQAVLEVEFGLVFTMVDRMLGGPGRAISRSVLTDIERPLIQQIVDRMFSALKSAWEGIVLVNPALEGMETSAQFVQIAPPSDIVVTILFEVKVGSQRGAMSLCIPYLVLKPITTKLSAQKWFASGTRKVSAQAKRQLSQQVNHAQVECSVELGTAKLALNEFMRLRSGDVVRLGQRTSEPIVLKVADVPKLCGSPALQGKSVVFTIHGPLSE